MKNIFILVMSLFIMLCGFDLKSRQSTDIAFFNLKGPVKKCLTRFGTVEFDRDGWLILIDNVDPSPITEFVDFYFYDETTQEYRDRTAFYRNDDSILCTIISGPGGAQGTSCYWKNGKVECDTGWNSDTWIRRANKYFYSPDGYLIKTLRYSDNCDAIYVHRITEEYTYDGFDKYGNYTIRHTLNTDMSTNTTTEVIDTLKIEYYE